MNDSNVFNNLIKKLKSNNVLILPSIAFFLTSQLPCVEKQPEKMIVDDDEEDKKEEWVII